jgi:hypothetical protein
VAIFSTSIRDGRLVIACLELVDGEDFEQTFELPTPVDPVEFNEYLEEMFLEMPSQNGIRNRIASFCSASPARNPFANAVPKRKTNDQRDCDFQHRSAVLSCTRRRYEPSISTMEIFGNGSRKPVHRGRIFSYSSIASTDAARSSLPRWISSAVALR